MKDILAQLYNGFLLRDLLGYVVPGGFVLICAMHFSIYVSKFLEFDQFVNLANGNSVFLFFIISTCYACGHFLSGIFFHIPYIKRVFSYSPALLALDYASESETEAWARHRSQYRKSCENISDSFQSHIERHAALVHFTGHFSAGMLFSILYIFSISIYSTSLKMALYALPLFVIFPGIFIHYRKLSLERYYLERNVILSSYSEELTDE